MRAVRSRDTAPEMIVRRLLHRMGYRYRLHLKDLPGTPDIVFGPRRKLIFVHGCFWHGHACLRGSRLPATNTEYWSSKIRRNVERYARQLEQLHRAGWTALTVWECEISDERVLAENLTSFLDAVPQSADPTHTDTDRNAASPLPATKPRTNSPLGTSPR